MGILLPPVVIRQVFVLSICFLVTCRLSGLVWTRCAHIPPRPHARPGAGALDTAPWTLTARLSLCSLRLYDVYGRSSAKWQNALELVCIHALHFVLFLETKASSRPPTSLSRCGLASLPLCVNGPCLALIKLTPQMLAWYIWSGPQPLSLGLEPGVLSISL